ncbi:MAG TPA: signal recognition particle-docking protein FtsY [Candidatus Nanoarchaeia archaeon]|nr:signal recognition particle-docking protein FtsY [Candidatus Nanoarchaeia archaeon]
MFDALKKKLTSWFSKPAEAPKKKIKKATKKEKPLKQKKPEKKKRTKQELQEERSVTKEILQDIKQEKGEEIHSIPQITPKEETIKETPEQTEEPKQPEEEQKPSFFSRLITRITASKLTQEQFDEFFMELELTLLENNVALEAVDAIKDSLSKSLINQSFKKNEAETKIKTALKEAILSTIQEPPPILEQIKQKKPFIILLFGINGSGKTTSAAKLAYYFQKNKKTVVLGAADTFRAASIEQLEVHAKKLSLPLVKHTYGSDPAAVAFDTITYAKKHNIDIVIIDTAGRMYTKTNLLKEMEKIIKVSQPDLKLFVGESITGNDATDQARAFNETAGIDGIILTKADIDEKAGTILSVSQITKKPIYFLGTGQSYADLTPFSKEQVLKNLGLE